MTCGKGQGQRSPQPAASTRFWRKYQEKDFLKARREAWSCRAAWNITKASGLNGYLGDTLANVKGDRREALFSGFSPRADAQPGKG